MKKQRLPDERPSRTHKVRFGPDDSLNLIVSFFEDGRIAELFAYAYRQGSREAGLLDSLCLAISIGLQHGVPLAEYAEKLRHQAYEPHGMTSNRAIPHASSYSDYLAQYLPALEERIRAVVAAREAHEAHEADDAA